MDTKLNEGIQTEETVIQPAPAPEARPVIQLPDFSKAKKKSRLRRVIALVLVGAIVAAAVYIGSRMTGSMGTPTAAQYNIFEAQMRDIVVSLSGSGSIQAADSYVVTTLLSGEVLNSPFEEGDIVGKDDLLYTVDSADILTTIERAELTLSQSRNTLQRKLDSRKDLTVNAKEPGTVISLLVEKGDNIVSGQTVAVIRDSSVMSLVLPFGADDARKLSVGQSAQVTLDGSFETLSGTVSKISTVDQTLAGNMLVREVTIDVPNPGGISTSHTATAVVGDLACNSAGSFSYKSEYSLTAGLSGEVASVNVAEGDTVKKGQQILSIDSASLDIEIESAEISVRDAELNLDNQNDKLESYSIQSPISGTIIEKNYKEGDTIEAGKALCTIFDLSYLTLTLNIDELDISKVAVGQEVVVTADAVAGKVFKGVVTKVNINGTVMSGVTSYPVTIRIDETEGLLPGMNVDATISISRHENVLAIPSGAVLRGNRVLVQTDPNAEAEQGSPIPAGFEYVTVELGANDDEFVQVISGLNPGDKVGVLADTQSSTGLMNFGGMGGGMVFESGPVYNEVIIERP